jgi:hypothetical protein
VVSIHMFLIIPHLAITDLSLPLFYLFDLRLFYFYSNSGNDAVDIVVEAYG